MMKISSYLARHHSALMILPFIFITRPSAATLSALQKARTEFTFLAAQWVNSQSVAVLNPWPFSIRAFLFPGSVCFSFPGSGLGTHCQIHAWLWKLHRRMTSNAKSILPRPGRGAYFTLPFQLGCCALWPSCGYPGMRSSV